MGKVTQRVSDRTRRGFLSALLGGGTAAAALSPAAEFLDRIAPLSGRTWRGQRTVPETVESPHGPASVTYDEYHVPHVEAESEPAAYYALGYVQAADRLFEMDVFRRLAGGNLAAIVGDGAVEQDVLYTKLDFRGAAEASVQAVEGTEEATAAAAFAEGITAYIADNDPGLPFGLLGYEPEPWTMADSMLVGMYFYWLVAGSFGPLREGLKRETFDADTYQTLYPRRASHDAPILRETAGESRSEPRGLDPEQTESLDPEQTESLDPQFDDWLAMAESEETPGSNAWTISGEHTESGRPLVCSDPHLMLQAPPVWYEQRITVGDRTVNGVAIPGTPLFVVGENDHVSWGMTAAQVSQNDLYHYETDGDRYRYRGEWLEFDTETRTVAVAGGEDRQVSVKKTVHGPFLDREVNGETRHVGVGWVGHAQTRELVAFQRMAWSTGLEDFREALSQFDAPTLNIHYADTDGRTLFQSVGKIPLRRVDGELVPGDQVFDGSAGEGEWDGFEPFGDPDWDAGGFVSFEEMPSAVDADYVASANQRPLDDPPYPVDRGYGPGLRGERIYERLDETVGAGETVDAAFCESLQLDTLDVRARELVPAILDVRDRVSSDVADWLDELDGWDYHMDRDSTAALVYDRVYSSFREETWGPFFEEVGLSRRYWPSERVIVELPPDSRFFDGDRGAVLARAAETAVEELEAEGWDRYGDYNTTDVDHMFGRYVGGMNYPEYPTSGGYGTVRSFIRPSDWGASYRLVSQVGGETRTVLPGGNDGSPLSEHYDDQLILWADGEYRTLGEPPNGDPDVAFEEGTQ